MLKNIFKKVMLFSMIVLLNNSFIGTIAYATEQSNTLSSTTNSTVSVETSNKTSDGLLNKDSSKSTLNKNPSTTVVDENQKKDDKLIDKDFVDYGWKTINNKKYYLVNNKVSETTGWFMEKDINHNLGRTPHKNYTAKYYLDKDFSAVVGWKQIGKDWYYFDSEGIMKSGWIETDHLFYLDASGIMKTGWNKIDGTKYFFNQYGQATVGKNLMGDNWYFFDNKGRLQTGFYNNKGKTYYSDDSGIMVANKWIEKGNHKYYIKSDGTTAIGNLFLEGIMDTFDKNGFYEGSNSSKTFDLYVRHLNVGDADCAFIKLPSGETVLIDTGDTTTTKTLTNFLDSQNLKTKPFVSEASAQTTTPASCIVNSNTNSTNNSKLNNGKGVIDYVVLTHPHSDHIGGMIELLKNYNIGKVFVPKYFEMKDWSSGVPLTKENKSEIDLVKYDYKVYKDTIDALSKSGLPVIEAGPNDYIDNQKILQFLNINKDYTNLGLKTFSGPYWGLNDNSAIVYLNYYDLQELFTGDIQWNSESDFASRKALRGKPVDILKVPHHGNVGSSSYTFIGYVEPTIGIMSRSKGRVTTTGEPYDTLTTCGVNLYELSATDGLSVYATKDNWNIEAK